MEELNIEQQSKTTKLLADLYPKKRCIIWNNCNRNKTRKIENTKNSN